MKFEPALVAELSSISGLSNKVYPLNAPEKVRKTGVPYLIYISSAGVKTKNISTGYGGVKRVPVELNVVAANYAQMHELCAAVVAKLEDMEQRTIGTGGPYIQELTYETPVEIYEEAPALYRCLIDFTAHYEEVD